MTRYKSHVALAAILIAVGLDLADGRPAHVVNCGSADDRDVLLAQAEAPPPAPSLLPGGASSLREAYGDWVVACGTSGNTKNCAASQQQSDSQSGQRVLAIEVGMPTVEGTRVTLVLPFGIQLDKGVTLQVDDGQAAGPFPSRPACPWGASWNSISIARLSTPGARGRVSR